MHTQRNVLKDDMLYHRYQRPKEANTVAMNMQVCYNMIKVRYGRMVKGHGIHNAKEIGSKIVILEKNDSR